MKAQNVNTRSTLPRVSKPNMVMRSLRVSEKLWDAAKARADERQENISDVIRRALEKYAAGYRCRFCGNDVPHEHDLCDDCARKLVGMELKVPDETEASRTS